MTRDGTDQGTNIAMERRTSRVSEAQWIILLEFLERHPNLAKARGYNNSARGRAESARLWQEVSGQLNAERFGSYKSPKDWSIYVSNYKSKLKKIVSGVNDDTVESTGEGPPRGSFSDLDNRFLALLGPGFGQTAPQLKVLSVPEPLETSEAKPKKKSIVFASVKQACVDLVKKHGHPITLIDEEAFRSLIQLMPMSMKEKARITSEYIQKLVDSTGEEDEGEMSFQDDRDASDNDDETVERTITIKGEIEEVPCHCDARVTEGGTKSHQVGCPAAARQPYWNYFEVTTDEATCSICELTFSWTNITKLKDHLLEKHPTAEFVDDGEEFTRGPASDVWSHEETEEIYLEDFDDDDPLPPVSSRKRKRTSERLKSRDERPEKQKEKEKSREEIMREMRREREAVSAARMRMKELEPERFKSLDSFGQYVAELMKLIPKDKCLKYQVQIVQRLLQEQAAAG